MLKFKFKENKKAKIILIVVLMIITLISIILSMCVKNPKNINEAEMKVAKSYTQVEEDDDKTQSDFVKFDAYVLKDLDGDGKAEKLRGTCKEIGSQDTLYMQLNVNSEGTLKDAKIKIDGKNFFLSTSLVADNVINGNYISSNVNSIDLREIKEGTNALIQGLILSGDYKYSSTKAYAIQSGNINNYSRKDNKITLEGTYVNSKGEEQEIKKDVFLTVDWYGDVTANIDSVSQKCILDKENSSIKLNVEVSELQKKLMLSKLCVQGTIPQLNGYSPIEVSVQNGEYDKDTREFHIERSSQIYSDGTIENPIKRNYIFQLEVQYPQEAISSMKDGNYILNIPVSAYYEAYNNLNLYEDGIVKSNTAEREIQAILCFPEVETREYAYSTSVNEKLNKKNVLDVYKGVQDIKDDTYEVTWQILRMKNTQDDVIVIKQEQSDTLGSMETNCIKNVGIYFSGDIQSLLGENGTIKLYNNETNELIKTFYKSNWNEKYYYSDDVKIIRIETSSVQPGENGNIKVNNMKKIDSLALSNSITKEELLKYNYIYNYSTAICNNTVYATEVTDFKTPSSIISVSTNKKNISSQVENQICLDIEASNNCVQSWKDGKFLVKLPSQIVNANIDEIRTNSSNVNISKYSKYEQDGNIYIQIDTQNEKPINFAISLYMTIRCDPMTKTDNYNIEVYASNPENEVYEVDHTKSDIYDINNNGDTNDVVAYAKTGVNIMAPNNLITTENIIDENGNAIAKESENLEIDKSDLSKTQKIEIKIFNNYSGGDIRDVVIVGKLPFRDNTYVIDGNNMGSDYSTSMFSEGIKIPEELKDKVKIYYSEKDNVTRDLKDSNNEWVESPSDFSKIKSYFIDLSQLVLKIGDKYSFVYEINLPDNVEYNQNSYSTHAVYFNLDTNEGKLYQRVETNKLGILVAKKYNLDITDYEEFTAETVKGVTYNISDGKENIIGTTDENGNLKIKNLYVEKEYKITKTNVTSNYECDSTERKIKVNANDGTLSIENVAGEFKEQEVINEQNLVKLSLENKVKYALNLVKTETETQNKISNVKFLLKGKGISENGVIIQTLNDGSVYISGLYQNEIYTLKEIYAEGYKEINEEIRFKVQSNNKQYIAYDLDNKFKEISINKESGKVPVLSTVLENEKEDAYTFNLTKYQKNSDNVVPNTKFNIKGKWFPEEGKEYLTDKNGEIELTLYAGYEYTIKEIEAAKGYVLNEQEIKFIATKDNDGNLKFAVTQGNFKQEPNVVNNIVYVQMDNEKTFEIIKEDEETGKLLKGVKFAIYKVEKNEDGSESLSEAKNINGQVVGKEEFINKVKYRVLETDEEGRIQESLESGLYKVIEVQALEGYYLGSLEEHTYYFGIDESQKGESEITIKAEYSDIKQTSMSQTNDGGYVGVCGRKITKYNSQFEVEWEKSNELIDESIGNYYCSYNQVIQLNDGGYIALASKGYSHDDEKMIVLSKFNYKGESEWNQIVPAKGNAGNIIISKDNYIMVAVGKNSYNDTIESAQQGGSSRPTIGIFKYTLQGDYIGQKEFFTGGEYNGVECAKIMEDNNGNFIVYSTNSQYEGGWILKLDKNLDLLWVKKLGKTAHGYYSSVNVLEDGCIDNDGGYLFVGTTQERAEYGVYTNAVRGDNYSISAVIAKYSKQGELEWIEEVETEDISNGNVEKLYGILKLKDGSYVIQGEKSIYKYSPEFELESKYEFNKKIVNYDSDYYSYRKSIKNVTVTNNDEILIPIELNSERISATTLLEINKGAASIPQKTEIKVYNSLKEYEITTACGENGKISGSEEFLYEKVKHGKDATKEIVVTPNDGYRVLSISVNGENINFSEEEDNSVKIPLFKNVTQNKNVYATFIEESKMGEIIVNHYKTDTTEEVADKQIIRGNINDKYVTNPKEYIANYSLNTEKLPVNATGKITNETTQVTYYYNENPVKIVTSYINMETNEYMQDDNIQYKNIGEEYETQGMDNIPDGYELFKEPENRSGTILDSLDSSEINVVYYYKLKEYIVKTNVINDGGTISGQGKDAYEIVKHGEDSKKKIEIVPYSGYKISKIKINEKEIEINANDEGIVVIDKLENIKENKNITVEFEKIKSKVIIKYLGKETNQEISEEQIKEGEVGEEYVAIPKDIKDYVLVEPIPQNAKGQFEEEAIIVKYYYAKEEVKKPDDTDKKDEENKDNTDNTDQKDDNNDTNISNDNKPSNNVKETDNTTNKISNIINPHTGDYIIAVIIVLIIAISINVIIISKRRKGGNK